MVYRITEGAIIGLQPIAETRLPLAITAVDGPNLSAELQAGLMGRRVRAFDDLYGEGEFIYLQGLASTIVGAAVIYDEFAKTTTLTVVASKGPIAIAMSANVAGQFGWYQISGIAVAKVATAIVANALVYATATPGSLDDTVAAGGQINGASFRTADGNPAAGFALLQLDRASMSGLG